MIHPCCAHCGPKPVIWHNHDKPCVACMYDGEVYGLPLINKSR